MALFYSKYLSYTESAQGPLLTEIRCSNDILAYRIKRVLEAQGYWVSVIGRSVYFNHWAV